MPEHKHWFFLHVYTRDHVLIRITSTKFIYSAVALRIILSPRYETFILLFMFIPDIADRWPQIDPEDLYTPIDR